MNTPASPTSSQSYTCPKCGDLFAGVPQTKADCPQCNALLQLFKNGNTRVLKRYVPNEFSIVERVVWSLIGGGLLVYGLIGILSNDVYIAGKRSKGIHFHDGEAVVAFVGLMLLALASLLFVVDHYDKRDNEMLYHKARIYCLRAGLGTLAAVVAFNIVNSIVSGTWL